MVLAPENSFNIDGLESLLTDSRRRAVLELLAAHHSLTLTELAEAIAEREQGMGLTDIQAETVERIRISLHHNHLPKLADANLIVYAYGAPGHWAILPDSVQRDRIQSAIHDQPSGSL